MKAPLTRQRARSRKASAKRDVRLAKPSKTSATASSGSALHTFRKEKEPMKRAALGFCVATAFAASVAAQQPPATPPQSATPSQTPAAAAGETSLTGCLAKGADGGFTLTNVQQASASASAPTGTSGATSTPSPSGAGAAAGASASASAGPSATWMLKGGDLAAHVGHRITVIGKAASSSASGATSTSGAAAGATTTDPAASRPAATSGSSSMRTLE